MTRLHVAPNGSLTDSKGATLAPAEIADTRLHVPHLAPHILTLTLPKGDRVNMLIGYSSHCWTRTFDDTLHTGQVRIMDGIRPRAFCPDRYAASTDLHGLLDNLHRNRLYLTPSDRNFGSYNATTILPDGTAYTAFFTLKLHKGRFDGIRHKLRLYVESAHHRPQPEPGQKVNVAVIVSQALKGDKVKYFRR
ncbi:MAG: hypothetical protein COB93_08620 [Sneathiella sp.]|nr:MAG: hypothetical protein COB93_08620 [Sneathiella sp.]